MAHVRNGKQAKTERKNRSDERSGEKIPAAERIAILDERLGKGVGAKKERAKLQKLIGV